ELLRWRAPGNSGPSPVRRPRCRLATGTRAAAGLRPEARRPPARSWLMATLKRAAESAARRRKENAAAERRKARPARVMGRVISGDPEMGPLARRTTGCGASAPAPVGALLPSFFFRGAEIDQG